MRLPLIFSLSLGCFFLTGTAQAQSPQKLETVTIATTTDTNDALVPQYGSKVGIFAKYGIEVAYIRGANGPAMLAAVVGGSADITHVGAALIFPAIEKGAALTVLSGNYDIDYTLIAQKSLGLDASKPYTQTVLALRGNRIGVAGRGGATELYARKVLADAGMNPDRDVTFIAAGAGVAAAGSFMNDQVDALVTLPPSDLIIGESNFTRLIDLATTHTKVLEPNYLFTIFTSNPEFVTKRASVAQNFCRAVKETIAHMKDPANAADLADFYSRTRNLTKEQAQATLSVYKVNFNAALTRERWELMKKYVGYVPDWAKYTYEPCATISATP